MPETLFIVSPSPAEKLPPDCPIIVGDALPRLQKGPPLYFTLAVGNVNTFTNTSSSLTHPLLS